MSLFNLNLIPTSHTTLVGYVRINNNNLVETLDIKCTRFYEQFVSNNVEYIVMPILMLNSSKLVLEENNFTISPHYGYEEPIYFAYKVTDEQNTYKYTHDIVMCVYFLNNSNIEIEMFFDYYMKQGVEKIFMYYCGNLADRTNLPQREYVEYYEWNFINRVKDPLSNNVIHYSQVPLYNMFAKKIGIHCNWSVYVDLDEYIYHPTCTLKEYLADKQTHLFTQHRFSKVNPITKICMHESITNFPGRGKSILKGSEINVSDCIRVHRSCNAINCDLLLLHNKRSRKPNVENATVNLTQYF